MRRREFITLLSGAAAAWPHSAWAQQSGRVRRIGVVTAPLTNPIATPAYRAFLDELQKRGFTEGQNLSVEFRSNEQDVHAITAAAVEIVKSNVEVIFTAGPAVQTEAVITATKTIPIVILGVNYDPVARGHVNSLARPGGNITGVFLQPTEVAEKQVELLTQAFPDKTRLAVLWDELSADQFDTAARRAELLGLKLKSVKLENPPYDFDAAFRAISDSESQMLLILSSQFFARYDRKITELANGLRLPTMFVFKGYVHAGGLMSYGADFSVMARQAATYVAKILDGAKPADLPVERPNGFNLVLNLKTAKAIGVVIAPAILLRADEVIE